MEAFIGQTMEFWHRRHVFLALQRDSCTFSALQHPVEHRSRESGDSVDLYSFVELSLVQRGATACKWPLPYYRRPVRYVMGSSMGVRSTVRTAYRQRECYRINSVNYTVNLKPSALAVSLPSVSTRPAPTRLVRPRRHPVRDPYRKDVHAQFRS